MMGALVQGAGAAVGILERLLMGIFVMMGPICSNRSDFTISLLPDNKISENQISYI